jgi:hypothetical protein
MMACASGVWRAISSSVISSDMPFMLGKSRRVARPIPQEPHPRAVADYPLLGLRVDNHYVNFLNSTRERRPLRW